MEYTKLMMHTENGPRLAHELRTEYSRLVWGVETGEVYWIGVNAGVRRQGHARALWDAAQAIAPIVHSAERTPDGNAFAHAVGGRIPAMNWV